MYEGFANVYDHVMKNIPYEDWFDKLKTYLEKHGITEGTMCELGCGTGTMTEKFAKNGFSMIGVDSSPEMLSLAAMKKEESGLENILYIEQNMEELELSEQIDVFISVCDSINYILQEELLLSTFSRVKEYLKPNGYFIFDLKTPFCYREIIGNQTWVEQDDEVSYIWENYYYEDRDINEYMLTVFRRDPKTDLYERFDEAHYQRAYTPELLKELLEKAGLRIIDFFDGDFESVPSVESERYYIVAGLKKD